MIYPVFYPHDQVQYDDTGRIVFWTADLRRLREMKKRVVSLSASVQKMLDLCGHLQKEATGAPGNYGYSNAGTRFLDTDPRETCIKTLLECNQHAITQLQNIYAELEIEKDEWCEKRAVKYKRDSAAQARQQEASGDWQARRDRAVMRDNRDPAKVKFFWQ
jgi:hypothetical protein